MSRISSIVVVLSILAATVAAEECPFSYSQIRSVEPSSRFGLIFGISPEAARHLMERQGFVFKPSKGKVPVKVQVVSKRKDPWMDTFFFASEESGSIEHWKAPNVLLGFRRGELAEIFEIPGDHGSGGPIAVSEVELGPIVADLRALLAARFGTAPTQSPLPVSVRSHTLGPVQIYESMHWVDEDLAVDVFVTEAVRRAGFRTIVINYYSPRLLPEWLVPTTAPN